MESRGEHREMVRSITFGIQDSLVSTVGLISGVAAGGLDRPMIVMTGLTLIFVEAISMGFGELISAETDYEIRKKTEAKIRRVAPAAAMMFFSYFLAGLIPIVPYIYFDFKLAFGLSNLISILGLFVYGWWYGRSVRLGGMKHAVKMAIYGIIAIGCGVAVGRLLGGWRQ